MSWKVEGTYMESCSCDAICPCILLNAPTQGSCSALVGWKVDHGHFEDTALDGLKVVFVLHSPGKMHETPWDVVAFIDSEATPEQHEALKKIFGGHAGGHPAVIGQLVGNVLGIHQAAIDFDQKGSDTVVKVEGVADVEMEPSVGPSGQPVKVENHLLAVAPGFPVVVGSSKRSTVKTGDWDWDLGGHQCMTSPFAYAGP